MLESFFEFAKTQGPWFVFASLLCFGFYRSIFTFGAFIKPHIEKVIHSHITFTETTTSAITEIKDVLKSQQDVIASQQEVILASTRNESDDTKTC